MTNYITIAIAAFALADSATAATISYNLTGDTNNLITFNANSGIVETINLIDAATGLNQLPGFTLKVGDTINGTVTFSSPFTLPASTVSGEILLGLVGTGNALTIYTSQSLTYFNSSVQISPPSGLTAFGASGGVIVFGETADGHTATPSFTFSEIVFSGTVTGIIDDNFQRISSANLTPEAPFFTTLTFPVPQPATSWLVLIGLSGFCVLARRRKRASATVV